MAMPQQDDYIEQIHRLEGLMAYAEQQKDWDELERLKGRLRRGHWREVVEDEAVEALETRLDPLGRAANRPLTGIGQRSSRTTRKVTLG